MRPRWQMAMLVLLVVILMVQPLCAMGAYNAQATPLPAPFDLTKDNDGDGLPDELVAAVLNVEAVDAQARAAGADRSAADAAILDFYARLPYTKKTLALQAQLADVSGRLATVTSQEESDALAAELAAVQAKMMADPAYQTVKESLERMAVQRIATQVADAQAANHLFIPLLGTPAQAGTAERGTVRSTATVPALPDLMPKTEPDWGVLAKGDIIFVQGPQDRPIWPLLRLFTWQFEHAGTVVSISSDGPMILDSKFDLAVPQTGVAEHNLAGWLKSGDKVAFAHLVKDGSPRPTSEIEAAMGVGEDKNGALFNFNILDKNRTDRFYCAQLIYRMWKDAAGINLDSNSVDYQIYMTGVWGPVLGAYIAYQSIGVDEIWLGPTHVQIYALYTVP